ncbi:hypothetical protein [Mangrovibacterium sp.]|uniref:hypothetical protein n=1 Tax=Mangrovibacterium sp. TaxID=1961364 RepID=UPI0035699896
MIFNRSKGNDLMYENVDGSPFLADDFVPGEVIIDDSISYESVPLRYNIYTDKIEFKNNQDQITEIDSPDHLYKFNLGARYFELIEYTEEGQTDRGILELLVDGHLKLYKKYNLEFQQAQKAIGYSDAQPDRFVRLEDQYLLAVEQGNPKTFKNAKVLIENIKSLKPDISQYIKKEKVRTKTEKGLIQLIQYCNNNQ